jgi:hypothetical protein
MRDAGLRIYLAGAQSRLLILKLSEKVTEDGRNLTDDDPKTQAADAKLAIEFRIAVRWTH